ncbi:hypothetical protein SASPL_126174 [Salvia splendens]|uniref:PROP1-like PPR domain-containing protein n=1 Tax=Salvia splendens TaxID=180675 RepID=A0A8X8XKA6_SALSN|nr:hypothetical protein SASPL_126174 [Salvia splendens]
MIYCVSVTKPTCGPTSGRHVWRQRALAVSARQRRDGTLQRVSRSECSATWRPSGYTRGATSGHLVAVVPSHSAPFGEIVSPLRRQCAAGFASYLNFTICSFPKWRRTAASSPSSAKAPSNQITGAPPAPAVSRLSLQFQIVKTKRLVSFQFLSLKINHQPNSLQFTHLLFRGGYSKIASPISQQLVLAQRELYTTNTTLTFHTNPLSLEINGVELIFGSASNFINHMLSCFFASLFSSRRTPPQRVHRKRPQSPLLCISLIKGNCSISIRSSAYNLILTDAKHLPFVDEVQETDKVGGLNLTNIYHSRFFNVCKRQKAVKVAFRFTRLIRNPTLSTFNMLMSVCASSQDSEGAFQILQLVQEAALNADCKLYTTLISTCAKSGKVDTMFKVFHEMVNGGVEPNLHTYGALIDGCAKAGQVAKAFGAYGILRSKNVKPDRVVFNALITACGQSGAVDRAFDVLAEMRAELQPIDPDHVTVGALMKACASAGQTDRAREVYNMIHQYDIRGTAELYTIAVNNCSHRGDWEFACSVYDDMIRKGVAPDEMFISALIDVAGHAGKVDAAFEILQEARAKGMHVGIISYSSLMGACSKARDWQKALELYGDIKRSTLEPGVSLMNALITALCDADQLQKALEILSEMKSTGVCPNIITYSVLLVASEKKDDLEAGLKLFSQAKQDSVALNLVMCRCLIAMCLRRFQADCSAGEPVLSFTSGHVQLNSKWTSLALMVYRETIVAGVAPRMDELSLVLGCLKLPHGISVRNRLIENIGYNSGPSKGANVCSLINGFGEYDARAFSLVEEATSLGVIPLTSMKDSLIVVDLRNFQVHTAAVYLLTVLKGLKHRLAAGVKAPNLSILLPLEKAQIQTSAGQTEINMAGRVSQEVAALLRRLGLSYQGNGSYGKIRINGITIRKWFQPKLGSPFTEKKMELSSSLTNLASGINRQRSKIRTVHLSLE